MEQDAYFFEFEMICPSEWQQVTILADFLMELFSDIFTILLKRSISKFYALSRVMYMFIANNPHFFHVFERCNPVLKMDCKAYYLVLCPHE